MAYIMYLGDMPCPITPSKIDVKIKGQNKTLTLINDGEINILKSPGLTEISFDLLLPNVKHPFRNKELGYERANAKFYLDELERMKLEKRAFYYKLIRTFPDGKALYDNEMKVSLEDYTIKEDAKQGFDVVVSVKLKQYKDYATKIIDVETGTATTQRSTENAPSVKNYTVVEGDTLWNIAKRFYGDGSKYTVIQEANKNIIGGSSNMIYSGMVLTIPNATQDFRVKSSGASGSGETTPSSESKVLDNVITYPKPKRLELGLHVEMTGDIRNGDYVQFTYYYGGELKRKMLLGNSPTFDGNVDWGTKLAISVRLDKEAYALFNVSSVSIKVKDVDGRTVDSVSSDKDSTQMEVKVDRKMKVRVEYFRMDNNSHGGGRV